MTQQQRRHRQRSGQPIRRTNAQRRGHLSAAEPQRLGVTDRVLRGTDSGDLRRSRVDGVPNDVQDRPTDLVRDLGPRVDNCLQPDIGRTGKCAGFCATPCRLLSYIPRVIGSYGIRFESSAAHSNGRTVP